METLLVSLVSDQTIPNVQLINEFIDKVDKFLFISTNSMERKGTRNWIIRACGLSDDQLVAPLVVDQFSFDDIERKLDLFPFDEYQKIIVNLTGGTKLMTLAAFDFFKDLGAEIFYLTGSDDTLIKLSPGRKKVSYSLKSKVNLAQYLHAYGFELIETEPSSNTHEFTCGMLQKFIEGIFESYNDVLSGLRANRERKQLDINKIVRLDSFLAEIGYPIPENGKLARSDIKYLTGEWFEEYIAGRLATELNLGDDFLKTGLVISKKNKSGTSIPNEIDIMFTWDSRIYTIECKTSIFNVTIQPNGEPKTVSIIPETLYKSESLKQGMGLFANTYLFILDEIDKSYDRLKVHLERADLYNIKIIDREAVTNTEKIHNLLGIKESSVKSENFA